SLYISQGVFTLDIEIVVSNQNKIYDQVSFSNEIMLGSSDRFQIKYKLIPKSERPKLFKALDYIMDWKEDETSNSFSLSKLKNPSFLSQQEFVDKYDYNPPVKLSIDKFYFLKTFGSSFLYFLIFFFYYLLLVKNVFYFYYIIVNFITFPFAKALFDWMGVYKIRQRIDNEPFPDYYYVMLKMIFDAFIYHFSIFIMPFSLLVFLIRKITRPDSPTLFKNLFHHKYSAIGMFRYFVTNTSCYTLFKRTNATVA